MGTLRSGQPSSLSTMVFATLAAVLAVAIIIKPAAADQLCNDNSDPPAKYMEGFANVGCEKNKNYLDRIACPEGYALQAAYGNPFSDNPSGDYITNPGCTGSNYYKNYCCPCTEGKFKAEPTKGDDENYNGVKCDVCPAGKYQDNKLAEECKDCPSQTSSSAGSDAESDCLADAGYTGAGTNVAACAAGKFKAASESSAACTDCAAGKYKDQTAQTSDTCISCVAGKYKDQAGETSDTCINCPSNTGISSTGSDAESDCLAEAGYTGDGTNVAACAQGKFKAASESSAACTDCAVKLDTQSTASTASTGCVCARDFNGANPPTCVACAIGKYKETIGVLGGGTAQDCKACVYPMRDPSCEANKGYTGKGGYVKPCVPGTYKTVDASQQPCTSCPPNSDTGDKDTCTTLDSCVASQGYTGQGDSVVACAAGTFKAENSSASACTACEANTGTSTTAATSSEYCKPMSGYTRSTDGVVAACAAGKYKDISFSDVACDDCPELTISVAGAAACKALVVNTSNSTFNCTEVTVDCVLEDLSTPLGIGLCILFALCLVACVSGLYQYLHVKPKETVKPAAKEPVKPATKDPEVDLGYKNTLRVAFNTFDVDRSGELDKEEFRTIMTMSIDGEADGLDEAEFEEMFNLVDTDGSGKISFEEYYAWSQARARKPVITEGQGTLSVSVVDEDFYSESSDEEDEVAKGKAYYSESDEDLV